MLAGDGVEFLYTAVSRCKAPADSSSIYIVISRVLTPVLKIVLGERRSLRALCFWRASAGLLTGALISS